MNKRISATAFCKSITYAFMNTHSFRQSVMQVRGMLSRMSPHNLHIIRRNTGIQFRDYYEGKQSFISQSNPFLYELARKQYLKQLLKVLELYDAQYLSEDKKRQLVAHPDMTSMRRTTWKSSSHRDMFMWPVAKIVKEQQKELKNLQNLIVSLERGNLDIARVVMTPRQYKWYSSHYKQKPLTEEMLEADGKPVLRTMSGILVRSKSEQKIGNKSESLAVPYHYEEQLRINVLPLVQRLQQRLSTWLNGRNLYYPKGNTCYWNVPDELKWMNATGSIWRTYDYRTGKVTLYNDFRFLFADDTFGFLEHEGLLDDFAYRSNANERCSVMLMTGAVKPENLVKTTETQVNDDTVLEDMIATQILPRLWF